MTSADNQQERLKMVGWVVGITDGEGCFTVSINKNSTTKLGCQILPEFVITQGERSLTSLKRIERFFKCGRIFVNRRHDNHKENIYRYCVRSINNLKTIIIPFFEKNKLLTEKKKDFYYFSKIVDLMLARKHLSKKGIERIGRIIQKMNTKKIPKFLKSSETTRQTPK
ncbi:endonuclease [Candidatus Shapirobacteria bacterium CG03_land_8_20_14_0_80_39_12]|uniref:Endonuclease n=1 Tax=Candidatus Shapirobacteria bacterium CG03_land_8_20_14_0_80_39_12 TaxID=1974879 RepID=A0A2M7BC15_9BACT|nr:MAG: endonuclease [Candidatus Shapirobacteria bacterium CG03_land_8_20_14_0_80_39_12]